MLNESIIEKLAERLVNRVEEANEFTLRLLGERINEIGTLIPTDARKLVATLRYGGDIDKIAKKLEDLTDLNIVDIYKIFDELASMDLEFARQFYDYRGLDFIPFEDNFALQQQVRALARITANDYLNIVNTLGFAKKDAFGRTVYTSISKTYQETLDKAVLSIVQGKETYNTIMAETIKELGSSGIRTVDYANGYSRRLDSSVRMNIMDGIRNLHNEVQKIIGEEINYDGVEISVHENPAPDHQDIQGQQYSLTEFEQLNSSLERPISTMNCYHYIFSIILGVSKPRYTQEQLKEIIQKNNNGFEFEGINYTYYEGQQLQRKIETAIRKEKDIQVIAKASGNKELVGDAQRKISQLSVKYKNLSEVSGLPTKIERLKVNNFKREPIDVKKYYDEKLIGLKAGDIEITEVGDHIIDRKYNRNVDVNSIADTLQNPIGKSIIKTDTLGRKSINYIGMKSTVSINPDTGKLITVWKTGKRTINKYKGD